jgi:selenocysteine-specific elongation factor
MFVIGTAGHIDHGKSTLIKALTGTHPDRLKEEKERQMTIDLGFAWLTLPNGEEVGVVDVPGHRDFIENMLAGVGGIDAALLVIAADEGVMPQTREHLAILDLLQVKSGIVVISKVDLITEPEWLDLVELDIHEILEGTIFENAPVVRVSAVTQTGIPKLISTIQEKLSKTSPKIDLNRARLPIDRVFTITGFGTVVTGTLLDGIFQVGDEVEILPGEIKAKIRGLQTHKNKAQTAFPGGRTAVNLSGVDHDQVFRGNVLSLPGKYNSTRRFDAYIRLLEDASSPLKHNQEMKLFVGAKESLVRIRVLGAEEITAGSEGWIQLESEEPLVVVRSDRFILRRPSPGETIGGGLVINTDPKRRYKRYSKDVLAKLEALKSGTPEDILFQVLMEIGAGSLEEIYKKSKLAQETVFDGILALEKSGVIQRLNEYTDGITPKTIFASVNWLNLQKQKAIKYLSVFHKTNPLRTGMPRQELQSKLDINQKLYPLLVALWRLENVVLVDEEKNQVALADFKIQLNSKQDQIFQSFIRQLESNLFTPPSVKQAVSELGEDLYAYLVDQELIQLVSPDVFFYHTAYQKMLDWVRSEIIKKGSITVVDFRDHFSTSRKYALAFLEYLDRINITKRDGDDRVLVK